MKKHKMPKEILVYVCDELDDGTPVYGVVTDIEQLPEDSAGQKIGVYHLNTTPTLRVRREME